jgi:hypothetical protein
MKIIKVFLASSSELAGDREAIEKLIGRKNKVLVKKGLFIELIIWEDFLDMLSKTRLQDEYNKAIKKADLFVLLFFTKVGIYTEEEFEVAIGEFRQFDRPLIYTYFKDAHIRSSEIELNDIISLHNFKEKIKKLGHFQTVYKNTEDLKFQLNDQIEKLLAQDLLEMEVFRFARPLKIVLDREVEFCRSHDVYFYTASLFLALLKIENSFTASCLNAAKMGYADLLQIKLTNFVKNDLVVLKNGKPFSEVKWSNRQEMKIANDLAAKKNENLISEADLLSAILETDSNTLRMVKADLGMNWEKFVINLKSGLVNKTPLL